ncbi:TPA: hypothetical protein QDC44_001627 [Burkholderia cepacia ATCC 25416]|uniref:hypothetical protein n=1 Tax=Burkholderia cepacia TaxID=292 RepID=UPI001CF3EC87|nr:hypothetical protein [Burkholderia cepacia]MCA8355912.1 hypothetical protein [Burkholderia cepacia]HDR9757517.1 hypothetical protein [Burkholderia cepacia ATCC 25416]
MSDEEKPLARQDLVAEYKRILTDVLDNRPSGTRQHLAQALGKHRSFVSQITNPTYATPIPVDHLNTIFSICHFSAAERGAFLNLYRQAHPRRYIHTETAHRTRTISVTLPDLDDAELNLKMDQLVADFARTLAQMANTFASPPQTQEET